MNKLSLNFILNEFRTLLTLNSAELMKLRSIILTPLK